MEYTTLGSTGLRVSAVGLGTATFGREISMHGREQLAEPIVDEATAHQLLTVAADRGINFIDTADTYGRPVVGRTERYIGSWLADRDREDFVLASKVGLAPTNGGPNESGLSRKHIRASIGDTLDRLGTDYLDLYLVHAWDETTPIEETLATLDALVSEGSVGYIGASNLAAWQLTKALERSEALDRSRFDVLQARYNAASRESAAALLDVCVDQEVALCPYSPLEGGFLTGKYERDRNPPAGSRASRDADYGEFSPRQWRVLDAVRDVADQMDATLATVAIRWLIERERPSTIPIIGPRTSEQLLQNLDALSLSLTDAQRAQITDAYWN